MSFNVTILGSSGALPAYGRFPSAQLVEVQNRYFLVDCGEGTQMQMMKFQVSFHRISHIFITHLHGDHYLGLMGLLFTMHLHQRTNELHIFSHWGLDEIITTHLRWAHSTLSFKIHFHPLKPDGKQLVFEDDALTVEAIPLLHRLPCSGYVFREKVKPRRINREALPEGLLLQQIAGLKKGLDVVSEDGTILYRNSELTFDPRHSRSYAYCSDTGYYEELIDDIRGVDLLYHEATFMMSDTYKAMETLHSTSDQAATIALKAGVKELLLGHFSARYRDLEPLLLEARQTFPNCKLVVEGEVYSIKE